MTYLKASKEGYILAEKTQDEYLAAAVDAYERAYSDIMDLIKEQYAKLATVDKKDYAKELAKYKRLETLKEEIAKAYNRATREVNSVLTTGLQVSMIDNYNRQNYLRTWLDPRFSALPINPDIVKYATTGNVEFLAGVQKVAGIYGPAEIFTPAKTLTSLLRRNAVNEIDDITQAVVSGILSGQGYASQRKIVANIIGGVSGNEATGVIASTTKIMRTEGARILNAASLSGSYVARSQGIDIKKQWSATLDGDTRSTHQKLDGQTKELEENFISPSGATGQAPGQMSSVGENVYCRCTKVDVINDQGPLIRRAVDPVTGEKSVISFKTYEQWKKVLDKKSI